MHQAASYCLRNGSGYFELFTMACGIVPDAPGNLQWLAESFRALRATYNGLWNRSGRSVLFTMACGTVPDAPGNLQWLAELFRTLRTTYICLRNCSGRSGRGQISR